MKKSAQISWFICILSFIALLTSRILIGHWVDPMWFAFIGTILGFALGVMLDLPFLIKFFKSHQSKQLSKILVRSLMLFISLVLLGSVFQKIDFSWDLSYGKLNSLSNDSKKALKKIKTKVELIGFYDKDKDLGNKENFRLLTKLLIKENVNISVRLVEASMNPSLTEKYNIKKIPSVIIAQESNHLALESWSEEKVINGITRLSRKDTSVLCLLQGHGEIPHKSQQPYSLSQWSQALLDLGYLVKPKTELEFIRDYSQCKLSIVASPKETYPSLLIEKIEEYVLRGFPLIIAVDPGKKHGLSALHRKFGIRNYQNYVLDFAGEKAGFNAATVIGSKWNKDIELGRWLSTKASVFAVASKLELVDSTYEGYVGKVLVSSSDQSFTKSELRSNIKFTPGVDEEGSFPVGIISEKGKSKVAVFSDSDFLTNEYFGFQGNRDLAIQLVSYLVHSEGDISVAKKHFYRELFVLSPVWAKLYLLGAVFPVPFILLAFSLWLFIKRRKNND